MCSRKSANRLRVFEYRVLRKFGPKRDEVTADWRKLHNEEHVVRMNIKMNIREIEWDGTDWIDLSQNRDQWRALVNTVMNLRVHKMSRSS
ncbi:hypothetical protein B7P43_G10978 [Cryptotermes secundus]|uniref:Uncharacterized protein n=1 Tax=Cryptotermes secundus TaxID=105785 RepID=A0A2J7R5P1_9NEOP|nr:hypothetical protein B7P43_G10978 [Cryptotermes secundus]